MNFQLPCCQLHNGELNGDYFRPLRIICIGRNYQDHALEMGGTHEREEPFFFFKPLTALSSGMDFILPGYSSDVHHELELIIALDSGGRNLNETQAQNCIAGFGLGLDMTCRDIQQQAKQKGRPWELAKGFDGSAPCSAIAQGGYAELQNMGLMTLQRNGSTVQQGHWREMIWSIPEILQQVSRYIAIQPGDLIFTGTPSGVGPVVAGDQLEATMEGFPRKLRLNVVAAKT